MISNFVKLIECPRDAMQGISEFIPSEVKVNYLNALMKVGFDTIDAGSFVSPKVIPQMADSFEVLSKIDTSGSDTKLLAIVPNIQGGTKAAMVPTLNYLGYPFSLSETFQLRNTKKTQVQSLQIIDSLLSICAQSRKELVVYFSMGFGNPYGDLYNIDLVYEWAHKLNELGVQTIALSDTIGVADTKQITEIFSKIIPTFPNIEFGAHLHTLPGQWEAKIEAAYHAGCRRFDGALLGFGGCPMATDDMTGNIATENFVRYFSNDQLGSDFNVDEFRRAYILAGTVFNDVHAEH